MMDSTVESVQRKLHQHAVTVDRRGARASASGCQPVESSSRSVRGSVDAPSPQLAVYAPERSGLWSRRPAEGARARGAVRARVWLFRALESNVVGQGVSTLHGHNNLIDPLYLERGPLVGRIQPVLNVFVALKALCS